MLDSLDKYRAITPSDFSHAYGKSSLSHVIDNVIFLSDMGFMELLKGVIKVSMIC